MAKRGGLGRGLRSLIPQAETHSEEKADEQGKPASAEKFTVKEKPASAEKSAVKEKPVAKEQSVDKEKSEVKNDAESAIQKQDIEQEKKIPPSQPASPSLKKGKESRENKDSKESKASKRSKQKNEAELADTAKEKERDLSTERKAAKGEESAKEESAGREESTREKESAKAEKSLEDRAGGMADQVRQAIESLPLEQIETNPDQPRKSFEAKELEELAESIRSYGLLQPIVVVKQTRPGHLPYRIIAGERRFKAAQMAGLTEIPAVIRQDDSEDLPYLSVVENIQRQDLSPLEEAVAYQQMMQTQYLTQQDLADRLGKSRSYVANIVRLLQLDEESLEALRKGLLTSSQARSLLSEQDLKKRARLRKMLVEGKTNVNQVESKTGRHRKKRAKNIYLEDLENRLSKSLGTKVEIRPRRKGCTLQIDCYSEDDLNRLMSLLLEGEEE